MPSLHKGSTTSSFPYMSLIAYIIVLDQNSSTIRLVEHDNPFLVPDLKRKIFSLSSLSMFVIGFYRYPL